MIHDLTSYLAQLRKFIQRSSSDSLSSDDSFPETEGAFNHLAQTLFRLQYTTNAPYGGFCERLRVSPDTISHWPEIPAIPAPAFKELELTCLALADRTTVFHSSGTTEQQPSRHFHNAQSLGIYEQSLLPWFKAHLLAGLDESVSREPAGSGYRLPMLFLTPSAVFAPHSSLAYMFEAVRREFGSADSSFVGQANGTWTIDLEKAVCRLRQFISAGHPVVLLGTAFNFVHLLDSFVQENVCFNLPEGSCVLETGGYKGQSRSLPKTELHELITRRLGIPPGRIVCEYGMSELSSQAYDSFAGRAGALSERVFHFAPWARAQVISPETGREVSDGEAGLLRVFDLANVASVLAIQTEDLAIRHGDGFELIGRAAEAEPRGCSLMTLG
jgi:Acyl-protein synthetase, LuxE